MQQEQGHKRETLDFVSNEQLSFFFPFHLNDTLQCTHPTLEIAFPLKKVELAGFSSSYSQPKYKLLYFFKGTSTDSGFSTFLTYEKDPYHFCH